MDFNDFDPEDAYDGADPLEQRVAVLARIADNIGDCPRTERDVRRRIGALELAATVREALYDLEDDVTAIFAKLGGS